MAKLKGELQADNGDILYPHTSSEVVFMNDGKSVEEAVNSIDVSWDGISGKPSTFPPSTHTHTKSQISDFPTSLPANGGNADTVDGKHASDFAPTGHGLGTVCDAISDWNNVSTNGWYMGNAAKNAPDTDWWAGYTIVHNSTWIIQKVCTFNSTQQWMTRYKINGVWSAWTNDYDTKISKSTANPSGGVNGDVWIKYS